MNFEVHGSRILVTKPTKKGKLWKAEVVKVGKTPTGDTLPLKEGDVVLLDPKSEFLPIHLEGEDYKLVAYHRVMVSDSHT